MEPKIPFQQTQLPEIQGPVTQPVSQVTSSKILQPIQNNPIIANIVQENTQSQINQMQQVNQGFSSSSNKKKYALIVFLISFVLIFLIAGVYYLFFGQSRKISNQKLTTTSSSMLKQMTISTIALPQENTQRTNVSNYSFTPKNTKYTLLFKQNPEDALPAMANNIISSPLYADNTLFFSDIEKGLFAIDANTGNIKWQKTFTASISAQAITNMENELLTAGFKPADIKTYVANLSAQASIMTNNYSPPAVGYNAVYVGGDDVYMYAFDEASGSELWKFTAKAGIVSSPLLDDNKVYFITKDGYIHALDAKTGKEVWEFSGGMNNLSNSPELLYTLSSNQNVLYTHNDGFDLFAVDKNNGKLIWKTQIGGQSTWKTIAFNKNLVIANNKIYVTLFDNSLLALDASTGQTLWNVSLTDNRNARVSNPSVTNKFAYLTDNMGNLYLVDAISGVKKASIQAVDFSKYPSLVSNQFIYYSLSSPIISGNNVYFSSNGYKNNQCFYSLFVADSTTGNIKNQIPLGNWNLPSSCGVDFSPTITKNAVYVVGDYRNIYSIMNK